MGIDIPRQSIMYLLVCLSVIIGFIFLAIVPSQRALAGLDDKISATRLRMEEQKALAPVYQTLQQRIQRQGQRTLPLPEKSALAITRLDKMADTIREIAVKANVEIQTIRPALNSLTDNSGTLGIEASAAGGFFSFRKFLAGLGGVPYIEHIEEIRLQQNVDRMGLEIKFRISRTRQ